jgi:Glycosyl transferases group 1
MSGGIVDTGEAGSAGGRASGRRRSGPCVAAQRRHFPYCAAADVLVAPSRKGSFHLSAIEAIARGLPDVVSARAGVSELVEDGRHTLVVRDQRTSRSSLRPSNAPCARRAPRNSRLAATSLPSP